MKIFITGGTGFLGSQVVKKLSEAGNEISVVSRIARQSKYPKVNYVLWDGKTSNGWSQMISGCDSVVNLAGEGIFERRWNSNVKKVLLESRVQTTKLIVDAISAAVPKPKTLISASAIGFYGDTLDEEVSENSKPGTDFLAEVCQEWENQAYKAQDLGVRVALPRIGIVLGPNGGALKKILPPFKAFLGGPLGSGTQWFPWIHIDDAVQGILFPLENREIQGPYNMVAPEICRMGDFCKTLGSVIHRPNWLRVPQALLKILLGERSECLVAGQRVSSQKLIQSGFKFQHPSLTEALSSLIRL